MKFAFNRTNFNDFSVYEINKRAGRAYNIPYGSKEILSKTPFKKERISSDLVQVLSGKWDFAYFEKNTMLPDKINTEKIDFDVINVPSTWQRTGYEPPVYLNCPYPFDDKPPYVPNELSVGLYRKFFEAEKGFNYIISFLGAIPCIDLYLNGKFVGYSEGAHNTAEFDITKFIKDGTNELAVIIHKWSNATFLECQDMFRENGIFRDVLLYKLPKTYINDFWLRTSKCADKWNIDASVSVEGCVKGYEVEIELTDGKKVIASGKAKAAEDCRITLSDLDVIEWNAEIPTLYEAYITLYKNGEEVMTVRNFNGFKKVEIKKDKFEFNGKLIKFKGVNHHDTHYKNGYVLSFEDIEKDIKLMKSLNVNAVRTSHYPPDHQFLVLCDIYGLYVIDEADIETHGCGCEPHRNIDLISGDLAWAPRYVDRVSRMFYRDRNRASVTMWSLGNESGGYACQDKCCEFLHENCPEIPVHYEGVIGTPRHSYDVVSEMYTNHHNLEKTGKHRRGIKYTNKPFYLCEYAHAMGVGPGGLEDYWKIIYKYDNLCGGCIWEWADHAVYHTHGKLKYTYGGDHGEKKHDGNFCVDGLMYPDRTPHNGALEMMQVYRPVRAAYEEGRIFFTNTNRFRNSDYITAKWALIENGDKTLSEGSIRLDIEPCKTVSVETAFKIPKGKCDAFLNIYYFDGNKQIAREQIILKEDYCASAKASKAKLNPVYDGVKVSFAIENGIVSFNSESGMLEEFTVNGKKLINDNPAFCKGLFPEIYRALLDNDARKRDSWKKAGYDKYTVKCESFEVGGNTVSSKLALKDGRRLIAKAAVKYEIGKNGVISVTASFKPVKYKLTAKHLPRFGLSFEMPAEYRNVSYYGMGEYENLSDFNAHCIIGRYATTVEAMEEPYIKPQDSGNRTCIRELELTNSDGRGLRIHCDGSYLSFNARKYSRRLLDNAKHREDLKDENTTAVEIDGFLRGTGTSSCGPDTLEQYDIDGSKGLEFSFIIEAI